MVAGQCTHVSPICRRWLCPANDDPNRNMRTERAESTWFFVLSGVLLWVAHMALSCEAPSRHDQSRAGVQASIQRSGKYKL
jgi:hypothetical protein